MGFFMVIFMESHGDLIGNSWEFNGGVLGFHGTLLEIVRFPLKNGHGMVFSWGFNGV